MNNDYYELTDTVTTSGRKRNHRIQVWLDDFEYQRLNILTSRTGMTREGVLRNLINGLEIKERPPVEYADIVTELRRIGVNLNQVAVTCNKYGFVDEVELRRISQAVGNMERMFADAFAKEQ